MYELSLFDTGRATTVIADPSDVAAFVSGLGLAVPILHDAVRHGEADAAVVTAHSTAASYGQRFWDGTITSLRDQLAPHGWTVERPGGLEVVRAPGNRTQITAAMGTCDTGTLDGSPDWKHPRGSATSHAILANQLSLADLEPQPGLWSIQTWWLLYRVSETDGERVVQSELSLPWDDNGVAPVWAYRLLLGQQSTGSTPSAAIPEPAPEPTIPPLRRRDAR